MFYISDKIYDTKILAFFSLQDKFFQPTADFLRS